jgi:hypothetical protein
MAYLLICDAMFWVLAAWFYIYFLFSFSPPVFSSLLSGILLHFYA